MKTETLRTSNSSTLRTREEDTPQPLPAFEDGFLKMIDISGSPSRRFEGDFYLTGTIHKAPPLICRQIHYLDTRVTIFNKIGNKHIM